MPTQTMPPPPPKPKSPPAPALGLVGPPPVQPTPLREPQPTERRFQPEPSLLERIIPGRKAALQRQARERFEVEHAKWQQAVDRGAERYAAQCRDFAIRLTQMERQHAEAVRKHKEDVEALEREYARVVLRHGDFLEALKGEHAEATRRHQAACAELERQYDARVASWERRREAHFGEQSASNQAVDDRRAAWQAGDTAAVVEYAELVLSQSDYPECCPKTFEIGYTAETGILVVDYQLPNRDALPALKGVKYAKSKDEMVETLLTERQHNELYDRVIYQVVLRTLDELFRSDTPGNIKAVAFNGIVHFVDAATGHEQDACIITLQTTREEFTAVNLSQAVPKECFRKLRGVGSSQLHTMTPVAPLLALDKEDRRFVDAYGVADSLTEGTNLASMDWEDFEHLIRELFEKEFASTGGEVKITQASHDRGVDAVAFDPDPIRGGKIVIQAKRYTNTVGVAAVRDLYGTVINEGANSGILVTTSDYGPDAYEFARDKPLKLLSGANLLHLLGQHGHRAYIDLQAARQQMSSG